jgi:hypothetical protein
MGARKRRGAGNESDEARFVRETSATSARRHQLSALRQMLAQRFKIDVSALAEVIWEEIKERAEAQARQIKFVDNPQDWI